jgi:ATP-dependent DNA ligase
VKWDGYRTLAIKDGARVTLLSRNLKDATAQYPTVARAVAQNPGERQLSAFVVADQ